VCSSSSSSSSIVCAAAAALCVQQQQHCVCSSIVCAAAAQWFVFCTKPTYCSCSPVFTKHTFATSAHGHRADTQNLEDAESRLSKFRCLMMLRGVGATSIGAGGRPDLDTMTPSHPGSCFKHFSNVTKD
jgi:hypothetical protein